MIASQRLSDKCFQILVAISQAFIAVVAGVWQGQQLKPEFLKISANNRIPAIVDRETALA